MYQANPSTQSLVQYAVLAMPIAFAGFPLYILAPDFYATSYGVSLAKIGLLLLMLRLFDAIQDPIIGYISDRYRQYTPYFVIFSAIILCGSIYGLFTQLWLTPSMWFILCIALAVSAYSVLSITLNAHGALWTQNTHMQTRIAASREFFGLLGLVVTVSLPGVLTHFVGKEQTFVYFSVVLSLLMAVAVASFLHWYRHHFPKPNTTKVQKLGIIAGYTSLSSDAKKLFLVYCVSVVASSIPAVLVIFFVRDVLHLENYLGIFLLLYFCAGACCIPVWKRISVRYGKYQSWLFSMLVAITSFMWAFTLHAGDMWQYALICMVSGIALGADLVFPPSILADFVHQHASQQHVAAHFALLTMLAKASLAIASVMTLPLLDYFGFEPNTSNTSNTLRGVAFTYAILPCIGKCIAAYMLWRICMYPSKKMTKLV